MPGRDWQTVMGMSHRGSGSSPSLLTTVTWKDPPTHGPPGRRGQEERSRLTLAGRVPHTRPREHRLRP